MFYYDESIIKPENWVCVEYILRNTGHTEIDHIYFSTNLPKNTALFNVLNEENIMCYESRFLNYSVICEKTIKPQQTISVKVCYISDKIVISNMGSAPITINIYEPQDREFIRKQLSETLRATVSQRLLPRKDTEGRIPACEVLVVTPTVKDFIAKDNLEEVYDLVKKGSFNDMITMNMSIYELYVRGYISEATALSATDNKNELKQYMRGAYHGANSKALKLKEELSSEQ